MIEKIKYHLFRLFSCKQMRLSCLAVMAVLTVAVVTLMSSSIYTVNIFDGEKNYTIRTLNSNATAVLSKADLKSDNYNIESTLVDGRKTNVEISYNFPVYITKGDETVKITFSGGTVYEALEKAGFYCDDYDFVEPSADTYIDDTTYIDYADITYLKKITKEAIPYGTDTVYSSSISKGLTTVQKGTNGVKEVQYLEKLVNGVSVEKTVTASTVISKPVNAKKIIGTKAVAVNNSNHAVKTSADVKCTSWITPPTPIELDAKGNPVNYKSKMTVRATAYTYTGYNCATGVAPKPGYIAVNPKVIPYGTKLYIKSPDGRIVYGYAIAADTGGFIKKHPTGIDLFLTSESACRSFGVRSMEVYIIG